MKKFFPLIFILYALNLNAQDTVYARRIIDTLTSRSFNGRGYTNDGVNKALTFIEGEFISIGLKPMDGKSYIQPISFPVNTFPGEMSVTVNGRSLRPGYEFIVGADSKGVTGKFDLIKKDNTHFQTTDSAVRVTLEDKLTWTVSSREGEFISIKILKDSLKEVPKMIELNIENRFVKSFKSGNLCGLVKGKNHSDSLIIFTAHYDHLGGMGKTVFFPGANDNASGVALLLGLAKYFAKNPQSYSIGFICFTGEENGLVGSEYFSNHPMIPLKSIRFLVNLDLTGTGIEGITVVNATEFKNDFALLKKINEKEHYLVAVNARGRAKNSDHYWFTEKGVSSFFIYALGGIKAYHDVYDISATLPDNEYINLSKLLQKFTTEIIKPSLK